MEGFLIFIAVVFLVINFIIAREFANIAEKKVMTVQDMEFILSFWDCWYAYGNCIAL